MLQLFSKFKQCFVQGSQATQAHTFIYLGMKPKSNQFWNESQLIFSSAMTGHDFQLQNKHRLGLQIIPSSGMFVCKVKTYMLVPFYRSCVPSLVQHRRMKHSAICSMKKPLKNTCAFALSARDLLWSDEAKEKGQTYCLSISLCSRAQKSNCALKALHCGVWWRCSTETQRGNMKWRLISCMKDWEDFL